MKRIVSVLRKVRFRDVLLLTLPAVVLMGVLGYSAFDDFYDLPMRVGWASYKIYDLRGFFKKNACDILTFFVPRTTRFDQKTDLRNIDIHIDKSFLHELNSDLPASGRIYKKAFLRDDQLNFHRVKLRYRGDYPWHWFFNKKSLRVKTSKDYLMYRQRILNFINPKTISYVQSYLPYKVASSMGILAPEVDFVRVFINNAYNGVHLYADQIDESFLRKMKRMPGNIFNGDNPAGGNDYYPGLPQDVFLTPSIWRKDVIDNKFPADDRRELVNLCRTLFNPDPIGASAGLDQLLAGGAWEPFLAYVSFISSYHWDMTHNWKLYFDPSRGKFVPICWDPNGWHWDWPQGEVDICNNTLFSMVMRDPRLVDTKNKILYQLVKEDGEDRVSEAGRIYARIRKSCEEDPYKWGFLHPPFVTTRDVDNAVEAFKERIKDHCASIKKKLEEAVVDVTLARMDDGLYLLKLDSRGWASARLEGVTLEYSGSLAELEVIRDKNRNGMVDEGEGALEISWEAAEGKAEIKLDELLYPGRVRAGEHIFRYLERAPLSYIYLIRIPKGAELAEPFIRARNGITEGAVDGTIVDNLEIVSVYSVHPWEFMEETPRTVVLDGGEHRLGEDLIIGTKDSLVIQPGTTILLDPGVSILSYGRVEALGEEEKPITFVPGEESKPWGVVAIQGKGANGSLFSHCYFTGGSKSTLDRVLYTGMLSINNAGGVRIENCRFSENLMSDDSLRAVYSDCIVDSCEFAYANGDAIDFDYSSGTIVSCRFLNTRNDAVDLMTSDPVVKGCYIYRSGDKGISVGEASCPALSGNLIVECEKGIESKDTSDPLITGCVIAGNGIGVNCYKKNWRYGGGGKGRIRHSIVVDNGLDFKLDGNSHLEVSDSVTTGNVEPKDGKRVPFADTEITSFDYGNFKSNKFTLDPGLRAVVGPEYSAGTFDRPIISGPGVRR